MAAPEKIYLSKLSMESLPNDDPLFSTLQIKEENDDIEYIRSDAFIEKAEKWLFLNLKMLMNVLDVEYDTHDIDIKDFIDDFCKHMKG